MTTDTYSGSFKYEGKLVEDGTIDARSGAKILSGIDTSIRFFISQENQELATIQLPIPVKIQKGSWEALIPTDLIGWAKGVGAIAVSTYLYTAAKKLAENDFKEKGIKDIVADAITCLQWLVRTGKHLGHLALRNLNRLKWDQEGFVGILNDANETLYIPVNIFKRLLNCPKNILSDLASVIEPERSLSIEARIGDITTSVRITKRDRHIFYDESEDSEILFPHLIHGQLVELDGIVTRGNEMTNTIGFLHDGHILTCSPSRGSIVNYKSHLFLACRIFGQITRADKKGNIVEPRPRIIFDNLEIIDNAPQLELDIPDDDIDEKR